jgi:hypothetical protein
MTRHMTPNIARSATVLVTVALSVLLGGCGPHSFRQATCVDVTDDCNWSVVVVRNDTPRAVAVRPCLHHCGPGDRRLDAVLLASGDSSPKKQYGGVYANTGALNWWEVQDTTGKALGCLVLDGHADKRDGDIVLVSQTRPCREHQPAAKPIGHTSVQAP